MRHSIERRRPLSVLVCDLVESTRYVDRLEPEDANEAFAVFRQVCVEAIRRYGGYAESVQGDAVRGLFGYPRALEIAAVRASQAALDIIAELQATPIASLRTAFPDSAHLRVRAGIATSTALVGGLTEFATEVPVSGRAPWLAARLGDVQKTLGEVNAVLITDETRERCGNFFDIEDAGQHALRGFDEPVRAWRVLRVAPHDSLAEVRTRRQSGPLVGRIDDLERLHGAWAAARRGAGQAVFLGGDAGIGKSRLLKALTDDVDRSMPGAFYRVRYQCYPYHANTSLYPFIRQLNKVASVRGTGDPEGRLDGLERGIVVPNRHREEVLRLSADLLALPCDGRYAPLDLSPPQRKERTRWMLVEQLCWLAERQPVLVVFEDAHWADPSTIEIIDHVLRRIRSERVLAVISHRPEFEPHIDALKAQNYERIALDPLADGESRALVGSIDAAGQLTPQSVDEVVQRSAGNPFFLEELSALLLRDTFGTGSAAHAATAARSVPGTLEDSLMARIDQLADQRHVLQCASVIGQEFSQPLLELAAGGGAAADIELLLDAGVFQQRGAPDEDLLAFRHALLQEQVYQSLPRAERQQLHKTIRETLEAQFPQHVLAVPELLAYHSQHAGDTLRALRLWQDAIGRSMARHACEEALAHAESALALVEALPESAERDAAELKVHIVTGAALQALHGFASGGAMRSFQRAHQLAIEVGSAEDQANVRRGMYACLYVRSQHRQTLGMAQALLDGAGNEPTAVAMAHYMLGLSHFWLGNFEASNERLGACDELMTDEVIGRIRASGQTDPVTMVALHNAWLQWMLGESGTAWTLAEQAVEAGREHSPLSLAMALFVYNALYANDHDGRAHPGRLRELKDIAREHHLAHPAAAAVFLEGHNLIYRGKHDAGIAKVSDGMALFDKQEAGLGKPWGQSFAVHSLLALGRADEALEIVNNAAQFIESSGEFMWKSEVQRLRGQVRRAMGEADWRDDVHAAFDTANAQGAARLALRAAIDLADAAPALEGAAVGEAARTLQAALARVDRWPSADRARAEQLLERSAGQEQCASVEGSADE